MAVITIHQCECPACARAEPHPGTPLRSPEVMLSCLRGTSTKGGLRVSAQWQSRVYQKGVKVTRAEMDEVHILRGDLCPQWNYTIVPSELWALDQN